MAGCVESASGDDIFVSPEAVNKGNYERQTFSNGNGRASLADGSAQLPYARNPRKNDPAVGRMCASIREFGFKIPCLVRSDGEIVDGHLRLKAAKKLGLTEIPVILCDEWTPAQVKAFRLMVNRSVEWAEWDDQLLAQEFEEIQGFNFDLSLTGFDAAEIETIIDRSGPIRMKLHRRLPRSQPPGPATCGCWGTIASSVATPQTV